MTGISRKVLPIVSMVAGFLVGVAVARIAPQLQNVHDDASKGVIASYVQHAKKNKLTKVTVPAMSVVLYPGGGVEPLESTVVEALLVSQQTENLLEKLITKNRFQILETIASPGSTPPELPAPAGIQLNQGEFLLTTEGGTVNIEGVEVQQHSTPKIGKRYLVFMVLTSNGIGIPVYGMGGLFEIENGKLKPYSSGTNPFSEFINTHGKDLASVKAELQKRGRTQSQDRRLDNSAARNKRLN